MERNRSGEGARALLFERLADEDPRSQMELSPFRTHTPAGLRASVFRRLNLILNTRATYPRPDDLPLTVLDFGLPDFSAMYGRDPRTHALLAREIRRTIEAFEPRLELATVQVSLGEGNDRSLQVTLEGRIRVEHITEPVSFSIPLTGDGPAEESI